jgi:hypothetical protein
LKIRVRITYAELLDPSLNGPLGVGEGHVRRWRAIVPRNVREPSKEVSVPRHRDVDRPLRLASTRQSSQHRGVLQTERHLTDGEVECVRLWFKTNLNELCEFKLFLRILYQFNLIMWTITIS